MRARDRGLSPQEIEGLLYEALASTGGGGLGVRMHGLDSTQIAALRDFFQSMTGLYPIPLAASEIYDRSRY